MQKTFARYQPSVRVGFENLESKIQSFQVGQWFILPSGARGQYLGSTHAGPVVNWVSGKFTETHAKANAPLREYAKIYKI